MSAGPGLALGTVQFGLAYGVVGRSTAISSPDAALILARASALGIDTLDTAPGYGHIEAGLTSLCADAPFRIVSKIAPLPSGADLQSVQRFVSEAVDRSVQRLGARLDALLFHRADDLLGQAGEVAWSAAQQALRAQAELARRPRAVRLGVSCYGPDELARVAARFPVALAQLPGNALDQRLHGRHFPGIELHLRSVFLQGLLLADAGVGASRVPACASALQAWQARCAAERLSPLAAALGVARALPGVHRLVVGVDDLAQLDAIHAAWLESTPLHWPQLACSDGAVIDPRCWVRSPPPA